MPLGSVKVAASGAWMARSGGYFRSFGEDRWRRAGCRSAAPSGGGWGGSSAGGLRAAASGGRRRGLLHLGAPVPNACHPAQMRQPRSRRTADQRPHCRPPVLRSGAGAAARIGLARKHRIHRGAAGGHEVAVCRPLHILRLHLVQIVQGGEQLAPVAIAGGVQREQARQFAVARSSGGPGWPVPAPWHAASTCGSMGRGLEALQQFFERPLILLHRVPLRRHQEEDKQVGIPAIGDASQSPAPVAPDASPEPVRCKAGRSVPAKAGFGSRRARYRPCRTGSDACSRPPSTGGPGISTTSRSSDRSAAVPRWSPRAASAWPAWDRSSAPPGASPPPR